MYEMSFQESEMVGAGFLPALIGVIGLGIAVAANSQAVYDTFTGIYEGFAAAMAKSKQ